MIKGFKEFIARGSVVDLAVGVIIGAAFTAVVTSLVSDIITPLIAALFGEPDFSSITLDVGDGELKVELFLNAVVSFLLIAAAVYFLIVAPLNAWEQRRRRGEAPAEETAPEQLRHEQVMAVLERIAAK